MALTDIVFNQGEGQAFIVELPAQSYSGTITDINTESNSFTSALVTELTLPSGQVIVISQPRRVR